jgi:hypothetical protein
MLGHARDLLTPLDGSAPRTLAEARTRQRVSAQREILAIECEPAADGIESLVGVRSGGNLRAALDEQVPGERARCTPLALLLDDLAGASLVAGWIWLRWRREEELVRRAPLEATAKKSKMEGICIGFSSGSTALDADGTANLRHQSYAKVPPLPHPQDPLGWHALAAQTGIAARRARRLDVWLENGQVQIEAGFQDSGTLPDGGRAAVHEYEVRASVDAKTLRLLAVCADPRILPYRECPAATRNIGRLVGQPLADFRSAVPLALHGTLGCTHLNDVLRSFADVPALLEILNNAAR